DPPIILFDEATSALDQTTETRLQSVLTTFLNSPPRQVDPSLPTPSKHTAVFIAHRLSTIANCDQIIVMKEGRVVERGNHEGLLRMGGLYARMWRAQQLEAE
ncbi:Iron-sulfur clusters transporter atm1, mitochondrial, partial [Chytridiales sp. JEL 0842]